MNGRRLRPRLLVVWAILVGLIGVIVVLESTNVGRPRSASPGAAEPTLLLPVSVDELGAVEIIDAGTLHRFERDAGGAWFYHGVHAASEPAHRHSVDAVAAERIERAFRALGRARIERRVGRDRDPAAYGVSPPKLVILVYRSGISQPLVQYAVGDVAPDTASRYVDIVGGAAGVVTIPNYQIENLLGMIDAVSRPRRVSGEATARDETAPARR